MDTPRSAGSLFRPYVLNGLTLANRVVMAPMTRSMSPGGVPTADVAAYYRRRAASDVGLILTEGTTIDHPVSSGDPNVPNFFGTSLPAWKRVVDEVHDVGGRIFPQLWHVGVTRRAGPEHRNPDLPSASPSGLAKPGKRVGDPMTAEDVRAAIEAFARGAHDARALGFDGVEIHGAHGYLVDQFFWEALNERDDEFGGDLAGRTRFAAEIVRAVRREVGPDYPVVLRFSQWKQQDYAARLARTPEELGRFLRPLVDAGVDAFHCSQRRFWEPEFEGSELNLAGWTKKITGKTAITVGSVGLTGEFVAAFSGEASSAAPLDALLDRLDAGEFDLVAVGRALLVDPAWARKIREGRTSELQPFTRDALATLS